MKKSFYINLFIMIICFCVMMPDVMAWQEKYDPNYDPTGCLKSGTCIEACEYVAVYNDECYESWWDRSVWGDLFTDQKDCALEISVLYYKDKNWQIAWNSPLERNLSYKTSITGSSILFSGEEGIYINKNSTAFKNLTENFICPDYVYADMSKTSDIISSIGGYSMYDELCFANEDDDYCIDTFPSTNANTYFVKSRIFFIDETDENPWDYSFRNDFLNKFNKVISTFNKAKNEYSSYVTKLNEILAKNKEDIELPDFCIKDNDKYFNKNNYLSQMVDASTKLTTGFSFIPEEKIFQTDLQKVENMSIQVGELYTEISDNCQKLSIELNDLKNAEALNLEQGQMGTALERIKSLIKESIPKIELDFEPADDCVGYLGESTVEYLQIAFNIIKYLAITILFALSIVDFVKAILSQDKDALNKAIGVVIKRAIIAVLVFFLPIVLSVLLDIIGVTSGTCGIS